MFLDETWWDAEWFARMGQEGRTALHPKVDIWGVTVHGSWIATGPDGWWMTFAPIPADRVRLLAADPTSG